MKVKAFVAQSCPTLSDPMDYSPSMEFSRKEYWSGLPFPSPGNLPDPGMELVFAVSPELAGIFITIEPHGKPSVTLDML